jgi:dinuclear metal center YbgI/SA1388 family protein
MQRNDLTKYLSKYLSTDKFDDYCPNGLQVEGKSNIKKIVTAVSASIELFNKAIEHKADAILVHHGIIWNYERPVYKGSYRERVKILLENNINLFAYHLPLDAHFVIGNNAQLAKFLGLKTLKPFGDHKGQIIGIKGKLTKLTKEKFFKKVESIVNREILIFPYGPNYISNVGIVSGDASKEFSQAITENLDAYITGEVSEHIKYLSQEEKVHYISAGHYATEQFGIKALGNHLKNKYKINVEFIDIPNPV